MRLSACSTDNCDLARLERTIRSCSCHGTALCTKHRVPQELNGRCEACNSFFFVRPAFHSFQPSRFVYAGLRAAGVPALARRLRDAGVVLCYHNVVAETGAGANVGDPCLHIPLERFRQQLRWLASNYTILPLRQFVDKVTAGGPLRRTAAVTFDDGYTGVFQYAWPVLRALGIPATVFVATEAAGITAGFWWDHPAVRPAAATPQRRQRWLHELRGDGRAVLADLCALATDRSAASPQAADWSVLRSAAASGIDLGVHSATHRSLPTLADVELVDEVVTSRRVLERMTGVAPAFFAYPYGLWDQRVRGAVQAAGYRAAFTLDYGLNRPRADPWALRRVNVPAGIGDPAFQAWTSGLNLRWTRDP